MKIFFDGIDNTNTYVSYFVDNYIGNKETINLSIEKENFYKNISDTNIIKRIINKICMENNEFLNDTENSIHKKHRNIDTLFRKRIEEIYQQSNSENKTKIAENLVKICQ